MCESYNNIHQLYKNYSTTVLETINLITCDILNVNEPLRPAKGNTDNMATLHLQGLPEGLTDSLLPTDDCNSSNVFSPQVSGNILSSTHDMHGTVTFYQSINLALIKSNYLT